jgi:hypothetical protein
MIYIPVRESHYQNAILDADDNCPNGTRVLAWVNYLKDIGIKRYYIAEKYQNEWYYVTVDVFPEDLTIWWTSATRDAYERDEYINSVYTAYDDDCEVIYMNPPELEVVIQ